jgi:SAM-dependent methyltransferase
MKDFNAARYGGLQLNENDGARRRRMAELVASFNPLKVLDAGCASGQLTREIAKRCGIAVCVVDASEECVEQLQRTQYVWGAYQCKLGEEAIPLVQDIFDVVHASEIIEHVFYTEAMLRDFLRVTKPGGRLILSTPNLASWFNRVFVALGFQPIWTETGVEETSDGNPLRRPGGAPAGHIRSFTLSSLKHLLRRTGWEIESCQGQSLFSNRFRHLDSLVSRVFPSLAGDLIVVARKPRRQP